MRFLTTLIAAGIICAAVPAQAGVCSNEIAMISKMLSGGGLGSAASAMPSTDSTSALGAVTGGAVMGGGAATGALGSGATDPATIKQATSALDQAKAADAAGNETSCMEYINQAKQLLGLIK